MKTHFNRDIKFLLNHLQNVWQSWFCSFVLLQISVWGSRLSQLNPPTSWSSKAPWHPPAFQVLLVEAESYLELKRCLHPMLSKPSSTTATLGNYLWLQGRTAHVSWELVAFSRLFLLKKDIMQIYIMSSSLCTYVENTFWGRQDLGSLKLHWHFSC